MIDQVTRDKILDAANIVDVVSEFVTLRKRGVNYVGLCPFHTDKTPSFYVSASKNICKCFACGEGGSPVYFIMKHEQLSYHDALRFLAKKYNIDVQERELTHEEKQAQSDRESMFIVNNWAQKHFSSRLHEHEEGLAIGLRYFVERGFREDIVKKFQLGYSLEKRDDLYQTATKQGYKKDFLEKTGLVTFYENGAANDRYRGRVIFPIHTMSGKIVGFGGRILKNNEKTAKYVNSPESDIYHKSNELYGIFFAKQAIAKADKCFLVEGYTDVISMHQAGVENVVASSGTALTHGQIHMIHRITNNITLIYDGDAAGIKAAIRGVDLLLEEGMNIKIVLLPDGEDPDSFARKHNAFEFSVYLQQHETDFIRFKTKLLLNEAGDDPIKRAKLISEIIHSIAVIPDNIVRSVYVKECSDLLDIKEQTLLNELNKIRANKRNTSTQTKTIPTATLATAIPQNEWTDQSAQLPEITETNISHQETSSVKHPPKAFISPFKAYEEALLLYVIQYGERTLFEYVEENESIVIKVPEYIHSELGNDDLAFLTPHYKHILDDAISHCHEANFMAARHFLSHTNPSVSQTAINLTGTNHKQFFDEVELEEVNAEIKETTDKKQLAKLEKIKEQIQQKQMEEFEHALRRDIFAFKEAYVIQQINAINKKMKELQTNGDVEEAIKLMAELQRLNEIKVILSKELGERIILKM
ncbi:MAG: DNA primase [Tannerella sp.]|jgi:DNA primase|nr:DNA primase [Tannerella sp.]